MWIFTSKAFVSVVTDRDNPSRRLVRARCPGDIEEIFPEADVFEDVSADYRYRTFVPADEVSMWLDQYVHGMDYTNFKNSITPEKKDYHHACFGVWSLMLGLQKANAAKETPA